jgi:hypothetical protein
MRNIARRKLSFRIGRIIVIGVLLATWSLHVRAAQDGSEGDEWMKWDNNLRQVYVRAYVQGLMNGFNRGCDEGVSAAQPKAPGDTVLKFMTTCISHSPVSQRDSMKMVDQITSFYTRYPEQRSLNISDVFLGLHAGLSLEQIHRHFTGSGR